MSKSIGGTTLQLPYEVLLQPLVISFDRAVMQVLKCLCVRRCLLSKFHFFEQIVHFFIISAQIAWFCELLKLLSLTVVVEQLSDESRVFSFLITEGRNFFV